MERGGSCVACGTTYGVGFVWYRFMPGGKRSVVKALAWVGGCYTDRSPGQGVRVPLRA